MEAAAIGSGSIALTGCSGSRSKESRICIRTCSSEIGGTWSCRLESSSMYSAGSRSARVERICPSLTKVGPRSLSNIRNRRAVEARRASADSSTASLRPSIRHTPARSRRSAKPCRAAITPIWRKRLRSWNVSLITLWPTSHGLKPRANVCPPAMSRRANRVEGVRFKFVHAADLHLDSPFRAVSADAPLAEQFRRATLKAFSRIVDLCLRERVRFLVIAGDLFDQKDRSVRARLALRKELFRLDAAGISTFIVHGNHDPLSDDVGSMAFPPSVKVFGACWDEALVLEEGRILCRVQGISYPHERVTEDLSPAFRRQGPEFTLGVLHANLGRNTEHENYAPCTIEGLASRDLDYWALGHVHTRSEHPLPGAGIAVYPGNPQGRHIRELDERGCVLVEVNESATDRRFFPMDAIRWHRIQVPLTAIKSLEGLEREIQDQLDAWRDSLHDAHV